MFIISAAAVTVDKTVGETLWEITDKLAILNYCAVGLKMPSFIHMAALLESAHQQFQPLCDSEASCQI